MAYSVNKSLGALVWKQLNLLRQGGKQIKGSVFKPGSERVPDPGSAKCTFGRGVGVKNILEHQ